MAGKGFSWTEPSSWFDTKEAVSRAVIGLDLLGNYAVNRFLPQRTWIGKTGGAVAGALATDLAAHYGRKAENNEQTLGDTLHESHVAKDQPVTTAIDFLGNLGLNFIKRINPTQATVFGWMCDQVSLAITEDIRKAVTGSELKPLFTPDDVGRAIDSLRKTPRGVSVSDMHDENDRLGERLFARSLERQ